MTLLRVIPTIAFQKIYIRTYILTFYLTFHLTSSILTFYLAPILAFYLTSIPTFYSVKGEEVPFLLFGSCREHCDLTLAFEVRQRGREGGVQLT